MDRPPARMTISASADGRWNGSPLQDLKQYNKSLCDGLATEPFPGPPLSCLEYSVLVLPWQNPK
jgi:hypothetical protein